MHIGAIPNLSNLPWHTWTRNGYQGCVKNIVKNEKPLDLQPLIRIEVSLFRMRKNCCLSKYSKYNSCVTFFFSCHWLQISFVFTFLYVKGDTDTTNANINNMADLHVGGGYPYQPDLCCTKFSED